MLPRADNRVDLNGERCADGLRGVHISCAWGDNDRAMHAAMGTAVEEMMDAAGGRTVRRFGSLARLPGLLGLPARLERFWLEPPPGAFVHEVGGARMGSDPAASVVDARNRCWGLPNVLVTDGALLAQLRLAEPDADDDGGDRPRVLPGGGRSAPRRPVKRIAIVAIGSWGDVGPLITLGSGLAGTGYEVVLVTHAAYAEDATRAGLDFAPLSGDPVAIPEDERGRQWLESGGNGLRFALHLVRIARPLQRAVLDEAYAACRSCAAVLHTPFASFATHVAERLALPSIVVGQQPVTRTGAWRAFLVPDGLPLGRAGNRLSYRLMEQAMWQPYRSGFQRWRREAGMPDAGPFGPAARLYTGRVPVVYGFSSLVVTRPADWPAWHRAAGYWTAPARGSWGREDARVAAFLRDGPPPVFVGFGSMTSRNPQRVLARVMEALRVVGCRGLLAGAAGRAAAAPGGTGHAGRRGLLARPRAAGGGGGHPSRRRRHGGHQPHGRRADGGGAVLRRPVLLGPPGGGAGGGAGAAADGPAGRSRIGRPAARRASLAVDAGAGRRTGRTAARRGRRCGGGGTDRPPLGDAAWLNGRGCRAGSTRSGSRARSTCRRGWSSCSAPGAISIPGHEYRLWDEPALRELIAARHTWFLPTWDRYRHLHQRADVGRLFVLYEQGGFYADVDARALRPLDELTAMVPYARVITSALPFAGLDHRLISLACGTPAADHQRDPGHGARTGRVAAGVAAAAAAIDVPAVPQGTIDSVRNRTDVPCRRGRPCVCRLSRTGGDHAGADV